MLSLILYELDKASATVSGYEKQYITKSSQAERLTENLKLDFISKVKKKKKSPRLADAQLVSKREGRK